MDEIIIKESRSKALSIMVLGSLMTMISVYSLYIEIINDSKIRIAIALFSTLYFGKKTWSLSNRVFRYRHKDNENWLLKINDKGILDHSSNSSVVLIRWEDIKSMNISRVLFVKYINIDLHYEKNYYIESMNMKLIEKITRVIPLNVFLMMGHVKYKINKILKKSPININLQTSKFSEEEVLNLIIEKFAKK